MKKYVLCIVILCVYSLIVTITAMVYKSKAVPRKKDKLYSENINKKYYINKIEQKNDAEQDIDDTTKKVEQEQYDVKQRFGSMFEQAKEYAKMMTEYTNMAKIWQSLFDVDSNNDNK